MPLTLCTSPFKILEPSERPAWIDYAPPVPQTQPSSRVFLLLSKGCTDLQGQEPGTAFCCTDARDYKQRHPRITPGAWRGPWESMRRRPPKALRTQDRPAHLRLAPEESLLKLGERQV